MRSSSCTVVAWEQQKSRVPWTSWVPERVKLPSIICKGLKGGRQTEMPRNLSGVMTNPLRRPALLLQHSCLGRCRCCSTGPDRTAGWMDDSSRPRQKDGRQADGNSVGCVNTRDQSELKKPLGQLGVLCLWVSWYKHRGVRRWVGQGCHCHCGT